MASRSSAHFHDRLPRRSQTPRRPQAQPGEPDPANFDRRCACPRAWLLTAGLLLFVVGGCAQGRPLRLNTIAMPTRGAGEDACTGPMGTHAARPLRMPPDAPAGEEETSATGNGSAGMPEGSATDLAKPREREFANGNRPPSKAGPGDQATGTVRIPALNPDPFADGPAPRPSDPSPEARVPSRPGNASQPQPIDATRPPEPPSDSPPRLGITEESRDPTSAPDRTAPDAFGPATTGDAASPDAPRPGRTTAPPEDKPEDKARHAPAGSTGAGHPSRPVEGEAAESERPRSRSGGPRKSRTLPEPPRPLRAELPPLDTRRSPLDEHEELRRRLCALRGTRHDRTDRSAAAPRVVPAKPPKSLSGLDTTAAAPGDRSRSHNGSMEAADGPGTAHEHAGQRLVDEPEDAASLFGPFHSPGGGRRETARATVPPLDASGPDSPENESPAAAMEPSNESLPLIVPLPVSSSRRSDGHAIRIPPAGRPDASPVRLVRNLVPIPAGAAARGRALVNAADASHSDPCCRPPDPSIGEADSPSRHVRPVLSRGNDGLPAEAGGGTARNLVPTSLTTAPTEGTAVEEAPVIVSPNNAGLAQAETVGEEAGRRADATTTAAVAAGSGPELFGPGGSRHLRHSTSGNDANNGQVGNSETGGPDAAGARAFANVDRVAALPARRPDVGTAGNGTAGSAAETSGANAAEVRPSSEPANADAPRANRPPRWTLFVAFAGAGALIAAICRRWIPDSKRRHAA